VAAGLQLIERNRTWSVSLAAIFLGCAVAAFGYLATYPSFQPAVWAHALLALMLFTLTAPVFFGGALLAPSRQWITAATVHATLYAAFMVVLTATFERRHSLGDIFAFEILTVLWGILLFELFLLLIAIHRSPPAARADGVPWLFTSLAAALLGGWAAGVVVWSETVPARIVAAAESAAGDTPYCLMVAGRAVSSRRDLTGLSVRAPRSNGYAWDFHAVLVAGADPDKTYSNWSYKTDRFELIHDSALNRQFREQRTRCQPAPHFARAL
jgi:hypothetical protein